MQTPRIASISIYPVKSFNAMLVPAARIVDSGGLEDDREFGLFDADGKFVNGKRNPKVHQLVASIDWKDAIVYFKTVASPETSVCFHIRKEHKQLEAWLTEFFDESVEWRRNPRGGFPDDLAAPVPQSFRMRHTAKFRHGMSASKSPKSVGGSERISSLAATIRFGKTISSTMQAR